MGIRIRLRLAAALPSLLLAQSLAGCRAARPAPGPRPPPAPDPRRCAALRPADSLDLSRAGFIAELLDPRPTPRTVQFHVSWVGRYDVQKEDLAAGVAELARACGVPLRGLVAVGPYLIGVYWLAALVEDSAAPGRVAVSGLDVVHGRIGRKLGGAVDRAAADTLLEWLAATPTLGPGPPRPRWWRREPEATRRDYGYDVLVLRVLGDSVAVRLRASPPARDSAAVREFERRINAVLGRLRVTFPDSSAAGGRAPPR